MWDTAWVTGEQGVPSSLIQQETAIRICFEGVFPMQGGEQLEFDRMGLQLPGEGLEAFSPRSPRFEGRAAIMGLDCSYSYRYSPRKEREEQWHNTTTMILSPASCHTHICACDLPSPSNELNRHGSSHMCSPSCIFIFPRLTTLSFIW